MANLMTSLRNAAGAMDAFERALTVVQSNVTNATTPGYVRQRVEMQALPFQPEMELSGGVEPGPLISARAIYAEEAVWLQAQRQGRLSQMATTLATIEPIFDITEGAGIAGAIDRLYNSFSQLSVTPNDIPARENVINRAKDVAANFNFSATSLLRASEQAGREIRSVVEEINRIGNEIRNLNVELRQDRRKLEDAGLDASLHSLLEELAGLVDFSCLRQEDGSFTVLLGGQTPLVMGDKVFEIRGDYSGAQVEIFDSEDRTITSQLQQGRLGGLLNVRNNLLPSYVADLNRLAESFADRVNGILAAGVDVNGDTPAVDLFTFDAANGSALTLAVTEITPEQIAAALPEAPGGNSNSLNLAALATSGEIDGFTFTEFYGRLGSRVGQGLANARREERSQSLLLSQAQNLRSQVSAVSLDEEAAALIEFQRSYQASAQLFRVLNEMTEVVFTLLR